MAEQLKHRAKIKARGLDTTGVTEDHARVMASTLGSYTMMICEVVHDTVVTDSEGNSQVTLRLVQVEPITDDAGAERVRELARAYSQQRKTRGGEVIPGTEQGLPVTDALDAASAMVQRDEDGRPVGVWDGDPDAPITPGLAAVPDPPEGGYCPYPGCGQENEHEGDHDDASDDEDAEG